MNHDLQPRVSYQRVRYETYQRAGLPGPHYARQSDIQRQFVTEYRREVDFENCLGSLIHCPGVAMCKFAQAIGRL
jgi:hypothetical protein